MKRLMIFLLLFVCAYSISSCGGIGTMVPTEAAVVEGLSSLSTALQSAGATVEVSESVIQDFFTPEGNIIKVNGQDIQVFEYETAEAMESEASQVAPDGGSVGTSMMMWMDAPHFYKTGRILILYIGSDPGVLNLLQQVIGPQFAGQ